MSALPDGYTEYPHRREGYDHDLYAWSNIHSRKPVRWPDDKSVAVWLCVSLEWFPIIPDGPFRAPGHMQTAYPDYRHYTARDYGNRVGVFRFLEAFEKAGVKASFATNAAIAERYPELIEAIHQQGGHEIIAHSTDMNGTITSELPEEDERALINDGLSRLEAAAGVNPKGWLSIARSQSWRTLDLLKQGGIQYCCDWVNDELPYKFSNGLTALPLNHELSDRQIITVQQLSADSWAESLRDAYDWLEREAESQMSARILPVHLTPYIMGLPYRIGALEELLQDLSARSNAWFAAGEQIVTEWQAQQ